MGRKGTIVFAGSLAQKPHRGGHTWVFLQYLLGFKQLGWNVLFLDRLEPEMCVDARGDACALESSVNLAYLRAVLTEFSLENDFSLSFDRGRQSVGLPRQVVLERVASAATFINVMGFLDDPEILAAAHHRVFFDIDPGFGQMWRELGLHDPYHGYDRYVTVGERVGRPDCGVPTCGIDWITTRQPIVLEQWPAAPGTPDACFTSIGAWRGPYGPVEYGGSTFGLRVHEFRRFLELPSQTSECFAVALDIHAAETQDLSRLASNGWRLDDPKRIARDPDAYRAYIAASKAEFLVAKNMYVQTNSGWFSDRSVCYLASGKPVLAQDTGLADLYPVGKGLLTYSTLDEALAGVEEISRDYEVHCRSARAIAEECFESGKVLSGLLNALSL